MIQIIVFVSFLSKDGLAADLVFLSDSATGLYARRNPRTGKIIGYIPGYPCKEALPGVPVPSGAIRGNIVNDGMQNDIDNGNMLQLQLKQWWEP
jgi:hypothetical protein